MKRYVKDRRTGKSNLPSCDRSPVARYNKLRVQAKRKGLACNIKKDEYIKLLSANICKYCGGPLSETGINLDRIDNRWGYTLKNVYPCCGNCNALRGRLLTTNEMTKVIKLLKKIRKKKIGVWDNHSYNNKLRKRG